MMTNAEKLATRPISELDVSAWPRCSTSYVQLPKDYPNLKCTGRTPEQASILNDIWVSVTSGSEDYSFKVRLPLCQKFAVCCQPTQASYPPLAPALSASSQSTVGQCSSA